MWSVLIAGKTYGPYNISELAQFISEGRVKPNTFVWTDGMSEWKVAGDVPQLSHLFSIALSQPLNNKKAKSPLYKRKGFIIALSIIFVFIIAIIFIGTGSNPPTNELLVEKSIIETSQTISTNGGVISINNKNSQIDGLELTVSKGAYANDTLFKISTSIIKNHGFGDLFNPITPLITVDNGHGFANMPMTVKIPIKKTDDEFVMAFFYDSTSGKFEGIPTLNEDNVSITIITTHFSDFVVTKVKKSILEGRLLKNEAETNFLPGMNDFFAPNYGSIIENGHCMGQSLAIIHYYNRFFGSEKTIRSDKRLDNNNRGVTPILWQDDSLTYRLCSVIQTEYTKRWRGINSSYEASRNKDDEVTFYSFAYAMIMNKLPQIMDLHDSVTGSGHAVVVYDVTPDYISISDPNKPGNATCNIKVIREKVGSKTKITLQPYKSSEYALSNSVDYDLISYYGAYALIEHDIIDKLWKDVLNGKDVGENLFPQDIQFSVLGRDSSGKSANKLLTDGFIINSTEMKRIIDTAIGKLYIAPTISDKDAMYEVYMGTDFVTKGVGIGEDVKQWIEVSLKPGDNDLGILYKKKVGRIMKYVNFYRFNVKYVEDSVESVPTISSDLSGDWTIQFNVDQYSVTKDELASFMSGLSDHYRINKDDAGQYFISETVPVFVNGTEVKYGFAQGLVDTANSNHWVFVGNLDNTTMTIKGDFQAQNKDKQAFIQGKWTAKKVVN